MTTYKPKKGHVIAIERLHSNHFLPMGRREEYRDWTLGRAARVTRAGIVEAFYLGSTDQPGTLWSVDRTTRVAVIGDDALRDKAERLLKARGHEPFESADELKAAIGAA